MSQFNHFQSIILILHTTDLGYLKQKKAKSIIRGFPSQLFLVSRFFEIRPEGKRVITHITIIAEYFTSHIIS